MACGRVMVMKNMKPYLLMVAMQFGLAGSTYIFSMVSLNHGMSRYVFIVYRNAIAALVLAPFALLLYSKTRPKMTYPVLMQIAVLGVLELLLDQGFTYLAMKYTSASFASAIMNAVPSVTFIIAVILRYVQRVKIKEVQGQAKVIGTILTLAGALLMTLYRGPVIDLIWSRKMAYSSSMMSSDHKWLIAPPLLIGTFFILIGCVAWSAFYILQSVTVKKYPAELSLSSLICFMGRVQSAAVAVAERHYPSAWSTGWDSRLLAPLYTGVLSSGIAYYVQGLVMKDRGPVFVTAFNPLCMIIVAALGSVILAEKLHLDSIIGGIIIAVGHYSAVWGKSKDYSVMDCDGQELPVTANEAAYKSVISGNKTHGHQQVKN
ncbi:LOW QUALITY PROTEIN: WAT1-related protein At4g08290-like [Carya illinoinensis]|uniref:LOW QUALITY PROTEIN: WAT1-related protein At4g08290-like n=1 Tax=Carya illinoinensis TaxID=32201 RepID=UPI001C720232|nr:LOW QUALITY PROTEIN: WAT1-related protein At4g08290-like [Carya illinoinensis]